MIWVYGLLVIILAILLVRTLLARGIVRDV